MFSNHLQFVHTGVLAIVLAMQVCAITPMPLFAQEGNKSASSTAGGVRPKIHSEGEVRLGRGGYNPQVFFAEGKTIADTDVTLYYEPLIFVQADAQGRLEHNIEKGESDDTWWLNLYVRFDLSPRNTQEQIRHHFATKRKALSQLWVINPLVPEAAWFESRRNHNIRSNLPPNTSFREKGKIIVPFKFPNRESAAQFIERLQGRDGNHPTDQLIFKYKFEGVSEESCTAHASYEDIQNIGRFRELFGEGKEGYAQRHQLAEIFHTTDLQEVAKGRCSDAVLLREMTEQAMKQLRAPQPTPFEQLKDYATLDNDLRSDVSRSLNEASRGVTREQDQSAFQRASSRAGSFSVGAGIEGFSGEVAGSLANASSEAKQLFRDVLKKYGISGEWDGERFIPRTLDVYTKEAMRSDWGHGVQIEFLLTQSGTATFPIMLTQNSWLRGEKEPHEDPEVLMLLERRLIHRIEELENRVATAAEERRAVHEGLNDMRELYAALKNRSVEIGLGEEKIPNVEHQATAAGFVTATTTLGGVGRCNLSGYASPLEGAQNPIYLRGVSGLQYGPGGANHRIDGYIPEDIHPYIVSGSIAFPVRENEFWTVTVTGRGCSADNTKTTFHTLKLSNQ